MESIQKQIQREQSAIAKGFSKPWRMEKHLERLAHLEACLQGDHEFTEYIDISVSSGKAGGVQIRCLWCDMVKK